jgi:hypothetical protein
MKYWASCVDHLEENTMNWFFCSALLPNGSVANQTDCHEMYPGTPCDAHDKLVKAGLGVSPRRCCPRPLAVLRRGPCVPWHMIQLVFCHFVEIEVTASKNRSRSLWFMKCHSALDTTPQRLNHYIVQTEDSLDKADLGIIGTWTMLWKLRTEYRR